MRKATHKYLVLLLLTSTAAMAQSHFDYLMKLGDDAMKGYHYSDAVDYYKRAVELDDQSVRAHLGLAKASSEMYVPDVPIPENNEYGTTGWNEYKKALALEPKNLDALHGIADLSALMKKFDPARDYYRQLIELDPKDRDNYYAIAAMDWRQSVDLRREVLGLHNPESLIHSAQCASARASNQERVLDGIKMAKQCLALDADDVDAMAYLNLLLREKADIECGKATAYAADNREADHWIETLMETEKRTGKKNSVMPPPPPPPVIGGVASQS